jgi:hypothetical protein
MPEKDTTGGRERLPCCPRANSGRVLAFAGFLRRKEQRRQSVSAPTAATERAIHHIRHARAIAAAEAVPALGWAERAEIVAELNAALKSLQPLPDAA